MAAFRMSRVLIIVLVVAVAGSGFACASPGPVAQIVPIATDAVVAADHQPPAITPAKAATPISPSPPATAATAAAAEPPADLPEPPAAIPAASGPAADLLEPPPTPSVRLMAVGDVMLGWEVGRKIVRKGPAAPWVGVKRYFDEADLVVANLECVISTRGEPWPSKLIHLRAPLAAADSLVAGGVDVVNVANNHALDFGAVAFGDTLAQLDNHDIGHAGGGANATAAHAPLIVVRDGLRIAFLGYVLPFSSKTTFNTREWEAGAGRPGLAIGTPQAVATDVTAAKLTSDIVVVMVHGGTENSSRPTTSQHNFAQAAISAGASLVLGHHPHVLQGYVRRGNTLVAFSLGNFMFARFDGRPNDSAILDVTLTADGVTTLSWIPVVIEGGLPRPAIGAEIARIMKQLPAL